MKGNKNIPFSFVGRHVYLFTLDQEWPEVRSTLLRDVRPFYVPLENGLPRPGWSHALENFAKDSDLAERMEYWADHFGIRDEWILDAAIHTLDRSLRPLTGHHVETKWVYLNGDQPLFRFDSGLRDWAPPEYGYETWAEFAKEQRTLLNSELSQYKRAVSLRYQETPEMKRNARWAVMFQHNRSIKQIGSELSRKYGDPEQAVRKAIKRFSESIGLTLRSL
jgi:hypothetical protein